MTPLDQLESLLVWILQRPECYGQTAGEIDVLLHSLHSVWARFAGRDEELRAAVEAAREAMMGPSRGAAGLLEDGERPAPVIDRGPVVRRVLEFWSGVDQRLGVAARADRW